VALAQMEATMAELDPTDLGHLTGLTPTDRQRLAEQGVRNLQDLADQATDDLEWPSREKNQLADWIMEARRLTGMFDEAPAEAA
jgi:predicted flap endonuclease-1-like 5' DNA nuclease